MDDDDDDDDVSLFLDLSARTFYLHLFVIHPCYQDNSAVKQKHLFQQASARTVVSRTQAV